MKRRLYSVDGLKVMFCLLIFVHHFWGGVTNYGQYGSAPFESIVGKIYYNGALGVEFFFIASGFMIAYNYGSKIKKMSYGQFIARRMAKLAPMAIISTLLGFVLSIWNYKLMYRLTIVDKPISFFHLVLSLLLINNGWFVKSFNAYGSGTWFLNVLLLCYIIWAVIVKRSRSERQYSFVLLCMILLGAFCKESNLNVPFLFSVSGRGYFNFFLGCILCSAYEKKEKLMLVAIPLSGLVVGLLTKRMDYIFSLILCPLLIYVALYIEPTEKILGAKIFKAVVPYTMCFYLSHVLIIAAIVMAARYLKIELDYSNFFVFLAVFLVCGLTAYILHMCVEIPASKVINEKLNK